MPRFRTRRPKPLSERIAERVNAAAADASAQLGAAVHSVADQASAGLRSASHRAPAVNRERLSQEAKQIADQAATSAVEMWERARERSHAISDAVPSREQLSAAAASIDRTARGAGEAVQERVALARDRAKSIEPAVEARVAAAKEKSVEIADDAVETGRNMFALILWIGAAVAAIYFLLLNRERREQIWSVTKEVASEARDMVNDLRGYDQEFA